MNGSGVNKLKLAYKLQEGQNQVLTPVSSN